MYAIRSYYAEYRGPSETGEGDMFIDPALWARYDFNLDKGALLFEGDITNPHNIQINSVENYIKFHMVSLMEKIRKTVITSYSIHYTKLYDNA